MIWWSNEGYERFTILRNTHTHRKDTREKKYLNIEN